MPGFIHIDIKYLPQMPDEASSRYLFAAIDRAMRWVFMRVYRDQSEVSSVDFLRRAAKSAPFKITKLLTDNGNQFTNQFASKAKELSNTHAFDVQCQVQGIEHRSAPLKQSQINKIVELFNGRISAVVKQTRSISAAELESTLMNYQNTYNHHIPQRALKQLSQVEALQN